MNQIKDFMVAQNIELAGVFRWTTKTLPPKFKPNSMSYYQAVEVSLIGGLMFGAALFFLQQAFFRTTLLHWGIAALGGVVSIFIQLAIYKRLLK
jgi:hypothetical protein